MLVGLSLLVASFTFLLYKIPPTTWNLPWFRPAVNPRIEEAPPLAPEIALQEPIEDELKDISKDVFAPQTSIMVLEQDNEKTEAKEEKKEDAIKLDVPSPTQAKTDLDRKAMPPPSFFKAPSKPAVVPELRVPAPPTFTSSAPEDDDYSVPSFPAINSAQRAGGGAGHIPPSSFSAINSAQRAGRGAGQIPRLNPAPQRDAPLRLINDPSSASSLPAPPSRAPLPNRGPPSSGLAPPPSHTSIPAKPRKKVQLTPGHSPLDWATLTSNPSANLTGLPPNTPYLKVPFSELKKMTGRKGKDAWTIYQGKVYNITPYLPYHPGGEVELMKCAGRDGTKLFNEVHPWVNWEGMLSVCLVGIAVSDKHVEEDKSTLEDID